MRLNDLQHADLPQLVLHPIGKTDFSRELWDSLGDCQSLHVVVIRIHNLQEHPLDLIHLTNSNKSTAALHFHLHVQVPTDRDALMTAFMHVHTCIQIC